MISISDLPFPKACRVLKDVKKVVLHADLLLDPWVVPKGTEVTLFTSVNFGYVLLPVGVKDVRGFFIHQRLFRY